MSKNQNSGGKNTGASASGFFADTLGPRPPGGAMLGKNGAAPQQTQAQHVQQAAATQKGAPQPQQRSAAAPRQPEPESPKKKKGWF